ncbi:MAG: hypothetical protein ABW085_16805 [Sedimenticola sp.]
MARQIIRPGVRDQIINELDGGLLPSVMFDIELNAGEDLIRLVYKNKPEFQFRLQQLPNPINNRFHFRTIEAPSEFTLADEVFHHEQLAQGRHRISSWAQRIAFDIQSAVSSSGFDQEFADEWLEGLRKAIPDTNEPFTVGEKRAASERVQKLEERLEELLKAQEATGAEMGRMHHQMEQLRKAIDVLDKRTWVLGVASRLIGVCRDIRSIRGEIKALLGDVQDFKLLVAPESSEEGCIEGESTQAEEAE